MPETQTIQAWMKTKVFTIQSGATLDEAVRLMVANSFGTLPVLDGAGSHIGTLSLADVIHQLLPDFLSLLKNIDYVVDYGALSLPPEDERQALLNLTVDALMEPPLSLEEDCSLARALALMEKHAKADLPVVRAGVVIGIVSWVDVGRAFLTATLQLQPPE